LRKISVVINGLVDLDSWDEEQEQELFECAVAICLEEVAAVLPPPVYDLLHSRKGGLDEKSASALTNGLITACRQRCCFPYLDEQDKRRVIRAVVWVLREAMKEGKDLKSYTEELQDDSVAESIVVDVFIVGAMDVFFDKDMRMALVRDMTKFLDGVPMVPRSVLDKMADRVLHLFSIILEDALKDTYKLYKNADQSGTQRELPALQECLKDDEKEEARVLEVWKGRPFMVQLRRTFITKLLERCDDMMRDFRIFRILDHSPRIRALILGRIVDLVFQHLPGVEKIENTVQPFHKELHGGRTPHEFPEEVGATTTPNESGAAPI